MNPAKWFLLLSLALPLAARSADFPANEFRHQGGALVCFSNRDISQGYLPCLRFGQLTLGQGLGEAEEAVRAMGGRLEKGLPPGPDGETRVYSLDASKARLEVTYTEGRAVYLQLSDTALPPNKVRSDKVRPGNVHPDKALPGKARQDQATEPSFSSIRLGDGAVRVVGLIGPPSLTESAPESGGTWWDYHPFPIRIEFERGGVSSIQLGRSRTAPGPQRAGN